MDIRNAEGRLVAKLDKCTDTITISIKGSTTKIIRQSDGTYRINNS